MHTTAQKEDMYEHVCVCAIGARTDGVRSGVEDGVPGVLGPRRRPFVAALMPPGVKHHCRFSLGLAWLELGLDCGQRRE